MSHRYQRFKKAVDVITHYKKEIHAILKPLSTYKSAQFEIDSAIATLQNAEKEIEREQPNHIKKMAVYHSSNVILYSYVLYGIIPSVYCDQIFIRPSTHVKKQTLDIHELLQAELNLPIKMSPISQRKFTENVANAQAVVFTGRYENSVGLREQLKQTLFLFFGSGTNPMIVGKNADISQAVTTTVKSRLINSGQDCLCQDVVFVDESIAPQFLNQLMIAIQTLQFGENDHVDADYGPIFYEGVTESVLQFWEKYKAYCIHRNRIDATNKIIDPLVFTTTLENMLPVEEFFAPVFYIVTYSDSKPLEDWLLQPDQLRKAMALSIFGNVPLSPFIKRYYTTSYNQAFFETESGNDPFGGFGVEASYAYYEGKVYSRPLLISREIRKFYGTPENNMTALTG